MRINALLSGSTPVAVRGFSSFRGAEGGSGQGGLPADVFVQGQTWKNPTAASRTAVPGGRPCACKTCAACATQAYAAQAGEGKTAAVRNGQPGAEQDGGEPTPEGLRAAGGPKGVAGEPLTQAERLQVAELELIDTKVRAHEMAHLAAAGAHATGGVSFQYAKGPDGKRYAVAGEVGIDTGREATPEATISKMQTVRAAALAPADPSPQDRKVAAQASLMIAEAGQELRLIRLEQARGEAGGAATSAGTGEKSAGSGEQPGRERAPGQKTPAQGRNAAAAIMAGLLRPASRIHIAV